MLKIKIHFFKKFSPPTLWQLQQQESRLLEQQTGNFQDETLLKYTFWIFCCMRVCVLCEKKMPMSYRALAGCPTLQPCPHCSLTHMCKCPHPHLAPGSDAGCCHCGSQIWARHPHTRFSRKYTPVFNSIKKWNISPRVLLAWDNGQKCKYQQSLSMNPADKERNFCSVSLKCHPIYSAKRTTTTSVSSIMTIITHIFKTSFFFQLFCFFFSFWLTSVVLWLDLLLIKL